MEEKVLVKGTMTKLNLLTIILCVLGVWFFFGGISELSSITYNSPAAPILLVVGIIFFAFAAYFHLLFSQCQITVTNKRVYGKAALGKRVDLPLDMISAVGVSSFKGVHVATASGKLTFYLCQNRDAVFTTISNLLVERQDKTSSTASTIIKQAVPQSNADELKKYKELLDSGVITQEEFDEKKKQLLGL